MIAGGAAAVLGAVAGSLVVGAYLAAAIAIPGIHAHANEAFAAARLTCHKNFLRLHVDEDAADDPRHRHPPVGEASPPLGRRPRRGRRLRIVDRADPAGARHRT